MHLLSFLLTFPFALFSFQVDLRSLEDPAIVEPCITVLKKLRNQLYSGLTTEMQVPLFICWVIFLNMFSEFELPNVAICALVA